MTSARSGAPRAPRFASGSSFTAELEAAVADHFRERGISQKANRAMLAKAIVLFTLAAASYAAILAPGLPPAGRWLACLTLGLAFAGLGMAVGHDAIHGACSHRPWVNRLLGVSFDLIGANSYIWRYTHNIAHHTYTNIEGLDLDIDYDPLMRFSPSTPVRRAHRLQALYAFALYALNALHWLFAKDFVYFRRRRIGAYTNLRHSRARWAELMLGKLAVLAYLAVVPFLILRPPWWQLAIGFLTVYVTIGITMGVIFQLAHAVEGPRFLASPAGSRIGESFFAHQLLTTADFACGNRLLGWYVGGLNFQIEHHLFPHICSVHYPALRPIVKAIAGRHGLPHFEFPTMRAALASHVAFLARRGRGEL